MRRTAQKADRLLIISRSAGMMNAEIDAKLRQEFADHLIDDFDPRVDFTKLISPHARVVVAGGDGTIEFVVRRLAESDHPLGILPLGSFNNLARGLGLPDDLDQAIQVTRTGAPRQITLGRVNGHVFVEACAVGLFGDAIVLGDRAKDLEFGAMVTKLRDVVEAKPFEYELSGDLRSRGTAMSLVFGNTASIGVQLPISDASPTEPYLEYNAGAGQSHIDIVGRLVASAVLSIHSDEDSRRQYPFRSLEVRTKPRVRVYADNQPAGRTPALIQAEVSALKVLLPRRSVLESGF